MEGVVIIGQNEWRQIKRELSDIKQLLSSIAQQNKQKDKVNEFGYISIKEAVHQFKTTKTTLHKKIKKYNVERLVIGNHKLIKADQLLEAFKQKEPRPDFLSNLG